MSSVAFLWISVRITQYWPEGLVRSRCLCEQPLRQLWRQYGGMIRSRMEVDFSAINEVSLQTDLTNTLLLEKSYIHCTVGALFFLSVRMQFCGISYDRLWHLCEKRLSAHEFHANSAFCNWISPNCEDNQVAWWWLISTNMYVPLWDRQQVLLLCCQVTPH